MEFLMDIVGIVVGSTLTSGLLWVILDAFDERLPYLHLYGLSVITGIVSLVPVVGVLIAVVLFYLMLMKWSGMSFWKTLGVVFLAGLLNRGLASVMERFLL